MINKIIITTAIINMLTVITALSQSAVFVYQNENNGKGDYMFVYGMPSEQEADSMTKEYLLGLDYEEERIKKYASTDSSGYGMILRSTYKSSNGLSITVYGAGLGAESYEEAEKMAFENLKEFHKEWTGPDYEIIQKFYDEPEGTVYNR